MPERGVTSWDLSLLDPGPLVYLCSPSSILFSGPLTLPYTKRIPPIPFSILRPASLNLLPASWISVLHRFKPALGLLPGGVTIGHLKEGQGRQFSFESLFQESGPDSTVSCMQVAYTRSSERSQLCRPIFVLQVCPSLRLPNLQGAFEAGA